MKNTSSFNIPKYKKNICEIIMETYNVDKKTANAAIDRSGLNDSLRTSPERSIAALAVFLSTL